MSDCESRRHVAAHIHPNQSGVFHSSTVREQNAFKRLRGMTTTGPRGIKSQHTLKDSWALLVFVNPDAKFVL